MSFRVDPQALRNYASQLEDAWRAADPHPNRTLAERFKLAITGGSDFHGANKPLISLGTGARNNLNVPDELADRLADLVVSE